MINLKNTSNNDFKPSINMLVFGLPKVGKSTFATTAPKPLIVDLEGGYKYMGKRGISVDVVTIEKFDDMREVYKMCEGDKYDTVVIDPVNELVEKLLAESKANPIFVQQRNSEKMTMDGWVHVKDSMKKIFKAFRDLNKHVIFVSHLTEKDDEGQTMKRPKVDVNLSEELCRNMDIIAYMTVVGTGDKTKRVLLTQGNEKYFAGDRTGVLGEYTEPDFSKIVDAVVENKQFSWTKQINKKIDSQVEEFNNDLEEENPLMDPNLKPGWTPADNSIKASDILNTVPSEESSAMKKMKKGFKDATGKETI